MILIDNLGSKSIWTVPGGFFADFQLLKRQSHTSGHKAEAFKRSALSHSVQSFNVPY